MTTTILIAAVAASVAAYTLAPKHHPVPEPPKSVAERGYNTHYIYHKGWHSTSEGLPKGERAGAASYPYTTPLHWEIPDKSGAAYWGDPWMSGYKQMHEHGESGFLKGNRYAYTGDRPLPAGTWTGEPLNPPGTYHASTWRQDVNGTWRKDEISGQAVTVETMTTVSGSTPPPKNP